MEKPLFFNVFPEIIRKSLYFRLILIKQNHIMKFFILAIFIAIFLISRPAQAGILSFLGDLIGINEKNEKTETMNSQTIPLLEARSNPETNSARGGGEITVINNNALLPDSGPLGTIADISETKPKQDQISIYIVREGDNLSQIAKMFGVSVNTIKWANDIDFEEQIKIGQTLIILPVTGIQYAIKKGDTIKSIAEKFNGDSEEIANFNGLSLNSVLAEGQTLIIPNGDYAEPTKEKPAPSPLPAAKPKTIIPSYSDYYLRPIDNGRKTQKIHGYNGIDLADSCSTPIMASASGDVIISREHGWNAGYGNYVVISHSNGTQTLYAHLSKNIVAAGWHVAKGQVIGYIGSTGRSTGCHVHLEIRGARNPF